MTCEAPQSFSPMLTVAKRKQALELRKVSEVSGLSFITLKHFSCISLYVLTYLLNIICFLSDYETFDGKEKARTYQRQPEPLEKPHSPPHWQRCKLLY